MAELTEQRVREIVREEITAEMKRQADAAQAELATALARLQGSVQNSRRGGAPARRDDTRPDGQGSL